MTRPADLRDPQGSEMSIPIEDQRRWSAVPPRCTFEQRFATAGPNGGVSKASGMGFGGEAPNAGCVRRSPLVANVLSCAP